MTLSVFIFHIHRIGYLIGLNHPAGRLPEIANYS